MITADKEPIYYRIKFQALPYEVYEYGDTALDAIRHAKAQTYWAGCDTGTDLPHLGSVTARPAVYKEWNHGTEHYTNGGDFIKDTSKPCVECGTPVEFHTHKTELGFCVECSWKYWNHELDA